MDVDPTVRPGPGTMLSRIREGMEVYDADGDHIGTVRAVFMGASSDAIEEGNVGGATDFVEDSLVGDIAEVFAGDEELPETLRNRLLNNGYIRIDSSGLFASDRFAMPDQIAAVGEDGVRLSVSRKELIEDE